MLIPPCFENSKCALVAMMGILRAGAAYVPVHPASPAERMASIFDEVKAVLILTSRKNYAKRKPLRNQVLVVDEKLVAEEVLLRNGASTERVTPQNAMYAILTSGSTGMPKSVVVSHEAYCTGLDRHAEVCRFHQGSRILQFASFAFDSSIGEIMPGLSRGAWICIPCDDGLRNNLPGHVRRVGIDFLSVTPSFAALLGPESLPSIKMVVLGREPLTEY